MNHLMKVTSIIPSLLILLFIGCNKSDRIQMSSLEKYWSSLDSSGFSLYLGETIKKSKVFTKYITADLETEEVLSDYKVDAADDPAIWINKENTGNSLILGTNKKGGVHVYDLEGNELQFIRAGYINNIDLRDNFSYKGKDVVLVAGSNCTLNTIALFYIDKEKNRLSDTILNIKTDVALVYGICMYKSEVSGKFYVFINGEKGEIEQWEINSVNGGIEAEVVRNFVVSSRPEGMVADDKNGILFIGVEEEGVLKVKAEPENEFKNVWVHGSNPDNRTFISADIEGLAYFKLNDKTYLLISSQGNFSYAIFEISNTDKYITSFTIVDDKIDGAEETDGLEIYDGYINEQFPNGMLVVHDGYNFMGDSLQRQNFKYIKLEKVESLVNSNTN